MEKKEGKIFGIGFHKTGLSSLLTALHILEFKATKGRQSYNHSLTPDSEFNILRSQNYRKLFSYIEPYDAIVDNPWNVLFSELDAAYPNSKFLFTYRKESEWLASAKKYFQHRPDTAIRRWIYGVDACDEITDEIYIQRYKAHNKAVLKYFQGREKDFIQMNIMQGDGWEKLCPFLEKPILTLPFPKQNTNLIR